MTYTIEVSKQAQKQLKKIEKSDLKKIARRIDRLSSNPFPRGHEKLKGLEALYRVRQGDFRITYTVSEKKLIVCVVKVGHRREVYR